MKVNKLNTQPSIFINYSDSSSKYKFKDLNMAPKTDVYQFIIYPH